MAEAIVSIVVGRITDLLTEDAQLLHGVRDEIQLVLTELIRIKTFLPDADSRIDEERVRILLEEIRELAYDAEHVVETFLVKASSSPGKLMQRMNTRKFSKRIDDIQTKMCLLFERFRDCNIKSTLESPESSNSSLGTQGKLKRFHSFTIVEPDIFVGFEGDVDRLVGHLLNESHDCYPLVSICGMGGLGKTTLAQKIYNNSTVKSYFAGLAWVSISQKWQTKLVLQRILICLIPDKKKEILAFDDGNLVKSLLQIQETKRCLIVLDDIWSTDAWDSLKAAFTAERSLSKLMLTSRNVEVAEHANPKGFIHQPECLSAEHSWKLLRLKALPRGYYLDNGEDVKRREEIGRDMVRKCAGLPLAIVILGGILVTKPSLIEWEKVYNDSLSSLKQGKGFTENQQKQLLDVLYQSYNDLPPQLKPCFLYFGKFNEDEWIDAEALYQLWIAEGMVLSSDKREGETMMQVAESYMGELVLKSMVQVIFADDSESSLTKFKSCSLHDLMRDLSLSRAKAEHFFEAIDLRGGNDLHLSMFPSTRQLVVSWDKHYTNQKSNSYFVKIPNHRRYRSLILVSWNYYCKGLPPVLGSHFANFRFLRVLAIENVCLDRQTVSGDRFGMSIGRAIGSLSYLRYISAMNSNLIIFPWVQKLVLLQTLKLDGGYITTYPRESVNILRKLAHLRHIYLPDWDFYGLDKYVKLRFNGLRNLETLENFNTLFCEVKDLPELTKLKRLHVVVKSYSDNVEEMIKYLGILALSSTSSLRYWSLHFATTDPGLPKNRNMIRQLFWNDKFNFQELTINGKLPELGELFEQQQQLNNTHYTDASLIRITTLNLWNSYQEKDPMPVLEKIPTLRDLKLYGTYYGKEMVCSAAGFPKLTRLTLSYLPNLENWRVEKGSMPLLSQLTIESCQELKELPQGLIYLNSLQKLMLEYMPSNFCDNVRTLDGEQGPDFYKVAHIPLIIV